MWPDPRGLAAVSSMNVLPMYKRQRILCVYVVRLDHSPLALALTSAVNNVSWDTLEIRKRQKLLFFYY